MAKVVVGGMGIFGFGRKAGNSSRRKGEPVKDGSTKDLVTSGHALGFDISISESVHGGDPVEDLLSGRGNHVFSVETAVF